MSEERQDRSDRLKRRFDKDRSSDQGGAEDASTGETESVQSNRDGSNTQESIEGNPANLDEQTGSAVAIKERPSVLMYLPENLHTELDIRFDELNARYKREHGRPLEKNRDYYPAVIKASLEGDSVEDVLDI